MIMRLFCFHGIIIFYIINVTISLCQAVSCPTDWHSYNERCFYINVNNDNLKTWKEADLECKNLENMKGNASLASIHSPQENAFIVQEAKKIMGDDNIHLWIGMYKEIGKPKYPYIWLDFSLVNYVNWDYGEPNDQDGTQTCCRMYEHNGKWDDFACSGEVEESYHGYVCQDQHVSREDSSEILPSLDTSHQCCSAGDVFAILFGVILILEVILAVLGYLYFYRWNKQIPSPSMWSVRFSKKERTVDHDGISNPTYVTS